MIGSAAVGTVVPNIASSAKYLLDRAFDAYPHTVIVTRVVDGISQLTDAGTAGVMVCL